MLVEILETPSVPLAVIRRQASPADLAAAGARVLRDRVAGGEGAEGRGRPSRRSSSGTRASGSRSASSCSGRSSTTATSSGPTTPAGTVAVDYALRSVRRPRRGARCRPALLPGARPSPRRAELGDLRPLAARVGRQSRRRSAPTSATCSQSERSDSGVLVGPVGCRLRDDRRQRLLELGVVLRDRHAREQEPALLVHSPSVPARASPAGRGSRPRRSAPRCRPRCSSRGRCRSAFGS